METKVSTITKEQLLANGWVAGDPFTPYSKSLVDKTHEDYDPEMGDLSLVLHMKSNVPMFAVSLPDGLLNINPASIEELNQFEKMILGYMPNY
jgi:hypothetical protein